MPRLCFVVKSDMRCIIYKVDSIHRSLDILTCYSFEDGFILVRGDEFRVL